MQVCRVLNLQPQLPNELAQCLVDADFMDPGSVTIRDTPSMCQHVPHMYIYICQRCLSIVRQLITLSMVKYLFTLFHTGGTGSSGQVVEACAGAVA